MATTFHKTKLTVSFDNFFQRAKEIKEFTSSKGQRYKVLRIESSEMFFLRLDAKGNKEWKMNLKNVYQAYKELEDFATINFKHYVPITHSPARGLLLHLAMLQ
ncbi:MAG: hypothetical protein IPP77_10965 [Bacteroidetes bacterium]|nr:hypothetical protein [Bacteroidota bacterium]